MSQLAGTSLIVETGGSGRTPLVWLECLLGQHIDSSMKSFFKEIILVDKSSQAILPVFFQKADVCVTTLSGFQTMVELNPQVGQTLDIIYSSPKLLRGMACFRSGYEEKYKNAVLPILKNLHKDPDGQQILIVMREEKLAPYQHQYLDTSRELFKLNNSIQGAKKSGNN